MALGVTSPGPFNLTSIGGSNSGNDEMSESDEIRAFKTSNPVWNNLIEGKAKIEEKLNSNPEGSEFFDTVEEVNNNIEEETGLNINPANTEDGNNEDVNLGVPQFNAQGWINSAPSINELTDSAGETANNVVNVPDSPRDLIGNVVPGISGSQQSQEGLGFMEKAFIGLAILVLGPAIINQVGGSNE